MPNYTLHLTEAQFREIMENAELRARISMGQLEEVAYAFQGQIPGEHFLDLKEGLRRLSPLATGLPRGHYHAIRVCDSGHISWDLYQVIRQRLALDGLKPGEKPNRIFTIYEDPMHYSKEPLARVEKDGGGDA